MLNFFAIKMFPIISLHFTFNILQNLQGNLKVNQYLKSLL